VEQQLREHFERAVAEDPGVAPDEMARAAINEAVGLRRRRSRLVTAGVAAGMVVAVGTTVGLKVAVGSPAPAGPPVTVAAAMAPVAAPSCERQPVERDATDAVVFLTPDLSEPQRAALMIALRNDPRIAALIFESREQAFQKFRTRWAQEPDLVAAVTADQLPESFRLRLVVAAEYTTVRSRYASMDGVEQVIGRRCAKDAPVGGTL
jgi:hypothetical protein